MKMIPAFLRVFGLPKAAQQPRAAELSRVYRSGITDFRGARLLVRRSHRAPDPIVYLEMVNSSLDPDGTYKHYQERIDLRAYDGDAALLCHAAMASRWHYRDDSGRLRRTFERWQDYRPMMES
jgi:hypothetical protein